LRAISENNRLILKNIEELGQKYIDKHLSYYLERKELLDTNWWEALYFFFFHSFMRGRRDTLSNEYCYFALDTLEDYLSIKDGDLDKSYNKLIKNSKLLSSSILSDFKSKHELGNKNSIKDKGFEKEVRENNVIVKLLTTKRTVNIEYEGEPPKEKTLSLGNDKDIMMVLDTLGFIAKEGRKNIYAYLKNQIANSRISKAYEELTEISNIADKIATFTLRDIGLMNLPLLKNLKDTDIEYVFPVDTWVVTVARKIGYSGDKDETKQIKQYFVSQCLKYKLNPLKVASGTWYLGVNSLDLLLEAMGKTGI
jgi:hypothetical protein